MRLDLRDQKFVVVRTPSNLKPGSLIRKCSRFMGVGAGGRGGNRDTVGQVVDRSVRGHLVAPPLKEPHPRRSGGTLAVLARLPGRPTPTALDAIETIPPSAPLSPPLANPKNSPIGGRVSVRDLSLIHISEPTRLGMISYAVF